MDTGTTLYTTCHHGQAVRERRRRNDLGRLIHCTLDALNLWYERDRQRVALARLDDRLLDDVGLGRDDVIREIAKPFWRK